MWRAVCLVAREQRNGKKTALSNTNTEGHRSTATAVHCFCHLMPPSNSFSPCDSSCCFCAPSASSSMPSSLILLVSLPFSLPNASSPLARTLCAVLLPICTRGKREEEVELLCHSVSCVPHVWCSAKEITLEVRYANGAHIVHFSEESFHGECVALLLTRARCLHAVLGNVTVKMIFTRTCLQYYSNIHMLTIY